MNTWAIGDVHGHVEHLQNLLRQLPLQPEDRLVLLGDLVDRGHDTPGVLHRVRTLATEREVVVLRGNHEVMMLNARQSRAAIPLWLDSGGDATLDAYRAKNLDDIPEEDWQLIESTLPYFETETAIYLHGSFDRDLPMAYQAESDLYWKFCHDPASHFTGKFVACGHTLQESGRPKLWDRVLCIDTLHPPKSEWLTAANLEKGIVCQAQATGPAERDSFLSL